MSNVIPSSVRSFLAEPAVPDPPRRIRRDWVLVALASIGALLEAVLRTDADWVVLSLGWQIASVVQFFVSIPAALLLRRTRPLAATVWGFATTMSFSIAMALTVDVFGGLIATSVMLIVPYALFRWGSGRHAAWGAAVLVLAGIFGNLADPGSGLGDWIGGFIVLGIPVEAGLAVRYRGNARRPCGTHAYTHPPLCPAGRKRFRSSDRRHHSLKAAI